MLKLSFYFFIFNAFSKLFSIKTTDSTQLFCNFSLVINIRLKKPTSIRNKTKSLSKFSDKKILSGHLYVFFRSFFPFSLVR